MKDKPVFLYNFVDLKRVRWEGPDALSPGKHTLEFDFKYDGLGVGTLAFNNVSGVGRGGTGVLRVDGKEVARNSMEHSIPLIMQWDENFDIGADGQVHPNTTALLAEGNGAFDPRRHLEAAGAEEGTVINCQYQ